MATPVAYSTNWSTNMTNAIRNVDNQAAFVHSIGRDHGDDAAKYMMYERGVVPWEYSRPVFVSICLSVPMDAPKGLDCEQLRAAYEGGKRFAVMSFYDMAVSTI